MKETEYVSPIAAAIAARKRKIHEFDISGFFHLNGDAIPKLGVWVPVKGEQDKAIVAAHVDISSVTKAAETARSDEDIIRDRKTLHILFKACLDPSPKPRPDGSGVFYYPAFPSAQWMADNLTTEQIGTLLNIVNGVRAKEAPEPEELDDITVERFHEAAVGPATYEITGQFLAGCGREYVIQLYLLEAARLEEARACIDDRDAKIAELEAKIAKLTEKPDEGLVQGGHQAGVDGDASG